MQQFIHNVSTGETTTGEVPADKIERIEATEAKRLEEVAAAEAITAAKQSALAKLAALGLTEEEANAILGL